MILTLARGHYCPKEHQQHLMIHKIYNGYWFWGRPSFVDLWHDLGDVTAEIRPDWDVAAPGLRQAWDAGEWSPFHGCDRRSPDTMSSPA
jgi:hypothetical protein